jgi:large repetitive protein
MGEIDITYIGIPKISISQDSISDTSKSPWRKTQSGTTILPWLGANAWSFLEQGIETSSVVSTEIGTSKIDLTKIGSIQVDPSQHSIAEIDSVKIGSSKVTLPSSIAIQQLLSSHLQTHDVTPILSNIYNTAQTLWYTNTPIDLNFDIPNLPTGQLAEGTITSYNINGTPKTATITIDDDANGVGWFLDTTPLDFSILNTLWS